MPLRGLIYFAHNIDGVLKSKGITLYGKKLVKIPSPDYYVLYNGMEEAPDKQDLKLSDFFMTPKKGYALLVQYTREYQANGSELKEAVEQAIDRCIQENHLKSYLLKKKAEVSLMLLTEFNQEAFARVIRKERVEEGEDRVNQLNLHLIAEKRFNDLTRAASDKQYQEQLYKEL